MTLSADVRELCLSFLPGVDVSYIRGAPSPTDYLATNGFLRELPTKPSVIQRATTLRVVRFMIYIRGVAPCSLSDALTLEILHYVHRKGFWWGDNMLNALAVRGATPLLRFAVKHSRQAIPSTLAPRALKSGSLACVRFVHEELRLPLGVDSCRRAASTGCVDVLRYTREKARGRVTSQALSSAIFKGSIECAAYLYSCGARAGVYDMVEALTNGDPRMVALLVSWGLRLPDDASCLAAERGNVPLLAYLRSVGVEFTADTIAAAASRDSNLATIAWLRAQGCPWDTRTCRAAASSLDAMRTLRYALENGCPHDITLCNKAAKYNIVEALAIAREFGCEWDASTCASAAHGKSLEALLYLRAQGCPWDAQTCASAARSGSLRIVRFAHEQGCSWDARTCDSATLADMLDILRYAIQNGCPWTVNTVLIAARGDKTAGHDSESIAHWIVNNDNCPWEPRVYTEACLYRNRPFVARALLNRKPVDAQAVDAIAALWPDLAATARAALAKMN